MSKSHTTESLKNKVERVVYTMSETKNALKHQMRNLIIKGDKYRSKLIFIEGEAGIGKTSLVKQILVEMKEEIENLKSVANKENLAHFLKHGPLVQTINYSACEAQDIGGMPLEPTKDEYGKYVQKYSNPLPQYGYGIYFQDEANRVTDPQMKTMQLSLWVDRGVNGNFLGDGYLQILAGNTFNDSQYKTAKQDDKAHVDRYLIIHLRPTFDEIMSYLSPKFENHPMIGFLRENKNFISLFNSQNTGFSPRTLEFFMNETDLIVNDIKDNDEKRKLMNMFTKAYFGDMGEMFLKYLNDEVEINLTRILEKPELVKKVKKHDSALMSQLAVQTQDFLIEKCKNKSLTVKEVETIHSVLGSFNKENQQIFLEWIVQINVKKKINVTEELLSRKKDFLKMFRDLSDNFATTSKVV